LPGGALHARFKRLQSLFDFLVRQFALVCKRILNTSDQLIFIQFDAQLFLLFQRVFHITTQDAQRVSGFLVVILECCFAVSSSGWFRSISSEGDRGMQSNSHCGRQQRYFKQ
jgi:hypothetical protein